MSTYDDHESVAPEGFENPQVESDDDAESRSVAEESENEEELAESSFEGSGELEDVPGVSADKVLQESLEELGAAEATGEEITPYEELINLPSIESFVFDQPESICGTDTRSQITSTTRVPWRWNCKLVIHAPNGGKYHGTGFLIGPCTVMTAGHCVHGGKGGQWMRKIEVIPGMDGAKRPYGTYVSSNLRSVTGWTRDGKPTHDYGAIILGSNHKVGCRVGYFGFANYSDSTLKNMLVNTAGYPADKPFGTQWYTYGKIEKVESRRLHYMFDTYGGQSGSSVWRLTSGQRYAVGIHAYGGCPNKATRIAKPVFDNMKAWRALCKC
ncbi:trypsin-like serine peptidase [Adonisia turfae]|uniref:Serine protease n=1 Tax=Adonisia turfae CCMR0081 TaxID=2292702 RepID=A0A6M0RP34_9CYAN|nr:trypsin-like serine protease [Adonisia turfae]NEZ57522.1 serine protease [Adonisia turfae CCMR0081]